MTFPDLMADPLIRDTFKAENCIHAPLAGCCDGCEALRILSAMSEPIKDGDRYFYVQSNGWVAEQFQGVADSSAFHPERLRLPDAFQLKNSECKCLKSMCPKHGDKPKPPSAKCFCGGDDQAGHNPMLGHTEHKPCAAKGKSGKNAHRIRRLPY